MHVSEAPPAGWYPDPTGRSGLRWWDGRDWTDHRRAPVPARLMEEVVVPDASGAESAAASAGAAAGEFVRRGRPSRDETTEIMAEVRRVARQEVERAVDTVTQRASDATRRLEPMLSEYGDRVLRGLKIAGIVVVALVVLWMVLQTVFQTSLLEFIGDRIDNITGGSALPTSPAGDLPRGT